MKPFSSIAELTVGLRQRDYSATELAQHYLARINDLNPSLNAFITVTPEQALAQAKAADGLIQTNQQGPLTGVPIAHKDIFCTKDLPTTCGSKMLSNFIAPYNATVVEKLNAAGTVLLGKTNMDEFAMGSSNENSFFGPVNNPWQTGHVPGGSSGGSASAVAADLCVAATGTDTGGSIRQPAAFCGISGLKPTYGKVSRYGMVAFASSLDQGGPMGHYVDDLALLLAHMSGADPRDSTSSNHIDEWLNNVADTGVSLPPEKLKIGIPLEYLRSLKLGEQLIADAVKIFEEQGHQITEVSLPHTRAAVPAYYVIAGAEASTNLSRYDGVRFGHRCDNPKNLEDLYRRSRTEAFGTEVKRRILTGTYALSVGYYDAYYIKAQQVRRLVQQDFLSAFETVDLLLAPTTLNPAFAQGSLQNDPVAMYQQDEFTVPVSLAGLPALNLPCGFLKGDAGELPFGMQLIGNYHAEQSLLQAGKLFQTNTQWHTQHPASVGSQS